MRASAIRRVGAVGVAATALGGAALPMGTAQAAGFKPADDGAKIVSQKWVDKAKTQIDFKVKSPALGGKTVSVRILVPKGYKATAKRTWPVVYGYHGGRDTYVSWTRSTDVEKIARQWDVMVVLPEGANGSYTNWYNGGKGGVPKWEDFHLKEVRQLVERNYRAGGSRATMGLSSGAQGACTYPGRAPGMFRYAACFSGVLSMRSPGIPLLLMYTNQGNGVDPTRIWGTPFLDDANWAAHDPIALLPKMKKTQFYISSGTTGKMGPLDNPNKPPWHVGYLSEMAIGGTNKEFFAKARQLGVKITAHIYGDGSHSWPYWQREMHTSWPQMMKALGAKKK